MADDFFTKHDTTKMLPYKWYLSVEITRLPEEKMKFVRILGSLGQYNLILCNIPS